MVAVSKFENNDCIPTEHFSSCILNIKDEKLKAVEILNPSYIYINLLYFNMILLADKYSKN